MTEKEILEGNKLIAEFMRNDAINSPHLKKDSELEYHYLWSSLMPVVEKIESLAGRETGHNSVEISGIYCRIYRYDYKEAFKSNDGRLTKIQATWNVIIQFIKWYNTQKQTP